MNPVQQQKHDEIIATSMLLGEPPPIFCSTCRGKGTTSGLFGSWGKCPECEGNQFVYIGPKTRKVLGIYRKHRKKEK